MTDTDELKKLIRMRGYTLNDVSKQIGISKTTLSYKINNKVEFSVSEIKKIQTILNLTDTQRDFIFLDMSRL